MSNKQHFKGIFFHKGFACVNSSKKPTLESVHPGQRDVQPARTLAVTFIKETPNTEILHGIRDGLGLFLAVSSSESTHHVLLQRYSSAS